MYINDYFLWKNSVNVKFTISLLDRGRSSLKLYKKIRGETLTMWFFENRIWPSTSSAWGSYQASHLCKHPYWLSYVIALFTFVFWESYKFSEHRSLILEAALFGNFKSSTFPKYLKTSLDIWGQPITNSKSFTSQKLTHWSHKNSWMLSRFKKDTSVDMVLCYQNPFLLCWPLFRSIWSLFSRIFTMDRGKRLVALAIRRLTAQKEAVLARQMESATTHLAGNSTLLNSTRLSQSSAQSNKSKYGPLLSPFIKIALPFE